MLGPVKWPAVSGAKRGFGESTLELSQWRWLKSENSDMWFLRRNVYFLY